MKSKTEAIREIIYQSYKSKINITRLKQLRKALTILGLDDREDRKQIESALEYRDGLDGKLYIGQEEKS